MNFVVGRAANVPKGKVAVEFKSGNTLLIYCDIGEFIPELCKMPVEAVNELKVIWVSQTEKEEARKALEQQLFKLFDLLNIKLIIEEVDDGSGQSLEREEIDATEIF
jgi:hypothetical protein